MFVGPSSLTAEGEHRPCAAGAVLLGPPPFHEVPAYLQHADLLVVPHAATPFVESLDPIKAREFLAVGRRVVATPVAGFRDLDPPITTAGPDRFVEVVLSVLDEAPAPPGPGPLGHEPVTWDVQAGAFLDVLDAAAGRRPRPAVTWAPETSPEVEAGSRGRPPVASMPVDPTPRSLAVRPSGRCRRAPAGGRPAARTPRRPVVSSAVGATRLVAAVALVGLYLAFRPVSTFVDRWILDLVGPSRNAAYVDVTSLRYPQVVVAGSRGRGRGGLSRGPPPRPGLPGRPARWPWSPASWWSSPWSDRHLGAGLSYPSGSTVGAAALAAAAVLAVPGPVATRRRGGGRGLHAVDVGRGHRPPVALPDRRRGRRGLGGGGGALVADGGLAGRGRPPGGAAGRRSGLLTGA